MVVVYVLVCRKATHGTRCPTSIKKGRNEDMQKRISRPLLTDFFSWIPVCIMTYLRVAGVFLPADAYIASAGFLLPFNSAMNPMLYSKLIGRCMSRARTRMTDNLLVICQDHDDDATKL